LRKVTNLRKANGFAPGFFCHKRNIMVTSVGGAFANWGLNYWQDNRYKDKITVGVSVLKMAG